MSGAVNGRATLPAAVSDIKIGRLGLLRDAFIQCDVHLFSGAGRQRARYISRQNALALSDKNVGNNDCQILSCGEFCSNLLCLPPWQKREREMVKISAVSVNRRILKLTIKFFIQQSYHSTCFLFPVFYIYLT